MTPIVWLVYRTFSFISYSISVLTHRLFINRYYESSTDKLKYKHYYYDVKENMWYARVRIFVQPPYYSWVISDEEEILNKEFR